MNIGKAMKSVREEQGLSLRIVAERLKITSSGLWKIENGKTVPKDGTIKRFCGEFKVSLARLYTMAFEPTDFMA